MTVAGWLRQAAGRLQTAGIDTARLDCLVLLEDVTVRSRAWLLAHDETGLSQAESKQLDALVARRLRHEPLAYIRGHAEFYGRRFTVSPAVLVPRPESEDLIELSRGLAASRAVDVGTGSGCLGITLKLERPDLSIMLSDIDAAALAVALRNAQALGADVTALQSDLLRGTVGSFDLVITNLPYVPTAYTVNRAAKHEPPLALYSGEDGLDHYRRLWSQLATAAPRHVVTESLPSQHQVMAELAGRCGYHMHDSRGFAQAFTRS